MKNVDLKMYYVSVFENSRHISKKFQLTNLLKHVAWLSSLKDFGIIGI